MTAEKRATVTRVSGIVVIRLNEFVDYFDASRVRSVEVAWDSDGDEEVRILFNDGGDGITWDAQWLSTSDVARVVWP